MKPYLEDLDPEGLLELPKYQLETWGTWAEMRCRSTLGSILPYIGLGIALRPLSELILALLIFVLADSSIAVRLLSFDHSALHAWEAAFAVTRVNRLSYFRKLCISTTITHRITANRLGSTVADHLALVIRDAFVTIILFVLCHKIFL